jgi:hypothetical protein
LASQARQIINPRKGLAALINFVSELPLETIKTRKLQSLNVTATNSTHGQRALFLTSCLQPVRPSHLHSQVKPIAVHNLTKLVAENYLSGCPSIQLSTESLSTKLSKISSLRPAFNGGSHLLSPQDAGVKWCSRIVSDSRRDILLIRRSTRCKVDFLPGRCCLKNTNAASRWLSFRCVRRSPAAMVQKISAGEQAHKDLFGIFTK